MDEGQYYSDLAEYEAAIGHPPQSQEEYQHEISIAWMSWVEQRVARSLLSSERKEFLRQRLEQTQDSNEIRSILLEAEEHQPIMGLEIIPQGQGKEMDEAIRLRVERDYFQEERFRK